MDLVKKVRSGLGQHCEGSMFDRCGDCPYYNPLNRDGFICRDELLNDANNVLKYQRERERIKKLRARRQKRWEETKQFLKNHTDQEVGLIYPDAIEEYDKLCQSVKDLGNVIKELEEKIVEGI